MLIYFELYFLRRQGHALTSCSLLLLYTVKMNTHFQSFVPFSHMISTPLNSNIVLKEKLNMLNMLNEILGLIYNNFIHSLFDFFFFIWLKCLTPKNTV